MPVIAWAGAGYVQKVRVGATAPATRQFHSADLLHIDALRAHRCPVLMLGIYEVLGHL